MRRLIMIALAILLCASAACGQTLEEELRSFMQAHDAFRQCTEVDYTLFDQDCVAAVMSTSMQSRLVILERDDSGRLALTGCYPQAVGLAFPGYGDRWNMQALPEGGFSMERINHGEPAEKMAFGFLDGRLVLRYARMTPLTYSEGLTFTLEEDGYLVSDGESSVRWTLPPIGAAQFRLNFVTLPKTLEAVWEDNMLRAFLPDLSFITQGTRVDLRRRELLPVYTAPSVSAHRAAKGKAAVSLQEPFEVLAATADRAWWLVYYDVSDQNRRIGYAKAPADVNVPVLPESGIPMTVRRVTGLFDDPWFGSASSVGSLKKGTVITVLGWVDACFAYAEAQVDGRLARGFIAMDTLVLPDTLRQREAEALLTGSWTLSAGGSLAGEELILSPEDDSWSVFSRDPAIPDPFGSSEYVLVLRNSSGFTTCFGLTFSDQTLTLFQRGHEGTYTR